MSAEQDIAALINEACEAISSRAPEEVDAIDALYEAVAWVDAIEGPGRHAALVAFARSQDYLACLQLADCDVGRISREASRALNSELRRYNWAKRWYEAPPSLGRSSIARLTECGQHSAARFATVPFATVTDDAGEQVIAGAVGCIRTLDYEYARGWLHIDIEDVIRWNPRTNKAEADSPYILPAYYDDLIVYADPRAFFSAWAAARCEFFDRKKRLSGGLRERPDNELPGALVIGDIDQVPWLSLSATKLIAGPGVDRAKLSSAVLKSARLPIVEGV